MRLDGHLRKLYKHTDTYLRAVSSMCEASRVLSDDFKEVSAAPHAPRFPDNLGTSVQSTLSDTSIARERSTPRAHALRAALHHDAGIASNAGVILISYSIRARHARS